AGMAERYRTAMRRFAGMSDLDVWYSMADMQEFRKLYKARLSSRQRKQVSKGLTKARTRDSMQEIRKLTRMVDGRPRIISDPPLVVPIDELLARQADRKFIES